jgi:uncharacterized membrane protein
MNPKLGPLSLLFTGLLILVIDIPWLYMTQELSGKMFRKIQGSSIQVVWWAALVVYVALAYLLLQTKEPSEAFGLGLATYAVYDFTNLATLRDYEPLFAVVDSLWGGVLFYIARSVLNAL